MAITEGDLAKGQWRILAIDDESMVHDTYRAIFCERVENELEGLFGEAQQDESECSCSIASHFRLDHAVSGKEGFQMLLEAAESEDPYAVLFLDMRMPGGWDGLETAEKIREVDPDVRIILITAYMDYRLTEIRQRIGVNFEFLTKPVDVNELLQLTLSLATQWSQARDLVVALEQSEAASRAKDEFLAAMSHELRTPLTTIIGNSELMAETGLTQAQRALMHPIETSGRGLLALINDILDLSRIESGKFQIDQLEFDLNTLINELSQTFSQRAAEEGLTLALKQAAPFTHQFIGDERRISQILINLLGNAIKFTKQGEILLEVSASGGELHFVVEDSGIGMSAAVLERIFSPFEQADQSISRRYGGTGLGLHISLTLAKLMGGEIRVESQEEVGSRFELVLPGVIGSAVVEQRQANPSVAAHFTGRVLVAEDTLDLQQLERKILESVGASVNVANNGKEAVELGLSEPYDLILMDMQMPEMDGIEATRLMRSVGNETPIVALTANVMPKHRAQFEEAGCNGFLSKPIDRTELIAVLGAYLASAEPVRRFSGTVLVAEGGLELQTELCAMLDAAGVEVSLVNNGREAVELGLATPYDLILLNLQMPEMGGVEAAQLMRAVGCETPMVMVGEDLQQDGEIEAAGCNAILSKPLAEAALTALLERFLPEKELVAGESEVAADHFVDEELMRLFVERTRVQRESIQQALEEQAWPTVRSIAHTVKGSGATFGFPEITRLGKAICDGLDNNEPAPVPALVRELVEEMGRI